MNNLAKLRIILTRRNKIRIIILFILSIFLSIIETLGISAIMPFIAVSSNPEFVNSSKYTKLIYDFFNFDTVTNFVIVFGLFLVVFYIFRAIYNIIFIYTLNKFTSEVSREFGYKLFKNYVNLPYKRFVKRNISEFIKNITSEIGNVTSYIKNIMIIFSEVFTILILYFFLILVNWKMTLVLTFFMSIKVFFIMYSLKNKIKKEGQKSVLLNYNLYKILNETFGNFKIIKLIQNEEKLYKDFSNTIFLYLKSHMLHNIFLQIPRLFLETTGFSILILIVVYILLKYEDANYVLPIISMYALALYRILPALNRILSSYSEVIFYSKSFDVIYKELTDIQEFEGKEKINFKNKIELSNINFEYNKNKSVLKDITLTINKGDKIAFIGESGSGKSTLVDLIIGIYKPTIGKIYIDGISLSNNNIRSYRSIIGYIPQSIYLFDDTVAKNISFGYEYNENKIIEVLIKANIYEFLNTKEGIHTRVGDSGIQLSGGQKQRIGIARALYADPQILVLDEATSALDSKTEEKIMNEIYEISKDKTLLIIAHRLSTIEKCENKVKLFNGRIVI